jgi:DNA mismatch repair ATPase MutS
LNNAETAYKEKQNEFISNVLYEVSEYFELLEFAYSMISTIDVLASFAQVSKA